PEGRPDREGRDPPQRPVAVLRGGRRLLHALMVSAATLRIRYGRSSSMSGFRQFLLRGNLIDTAVGIVIGVAFATVVSALVRDLITPLIAAPVGKPDFGGLSVTLNHSRFAYGDFINALISSVLIAAVLYYLIVAPYACIRARFE